MFVQMWSKRKNEQKKNVEQKFFGTVCVLKICKETNK